MMPRMRACLPSSITLLFYLLHFAKSISLGLQLSCHQESLSRTFATTHHWIHTHRGRVKIHLRRALQRLRPPISDDSLPFMMRISQ